MNAKEILDNVRIFDANGIENYAISMNCIAPFYNIVCVSKAYSEQRIFLLMTLVKEDTCVNSFDLEDGVNTIKNKEIFFNAINFVCSVLITRQKVAIFCDAGISRSPAVIIGVLCKLGVDLENALDAVKQIRPQTNIDIVFNNWLIAKFGVKFEFNGYR